MDIFIAGSGRVGFHLARLLSAEHHSVTVIESERSQLDFVDSVLDVRSVQGSAVSVMMLQELGVPTADLFIAVTGDDEVNLISAATAKGLGAKQVVARVDDPTYLESNILYEAILGIDYLLSPQALTALDIVKYIDNPGVVAAEDFGRGLIKMRQMRAVKSPTINGKTLKNISLPPGVLLGIISRKGATIIPHGDTTIEPGDLVTLIGKREAMGAVQKLFQDAEERPANVVIMGGGRTGLHLAQLLESRPVSVKLFDMNPARCQELADKLHKTKVICRDATSRSELEQENAGPRDIFVATTADDERNIVASVLAKEVGVSRTITVVHQPDFANLVAKLGIDHAVTPRACVANRILRLVNQKQVSSLAVLQEGQVEILEFVINGDSTITGKPLREIRFPRGALVGTILRGEEVIVPTGDDRVEQGDSVIVIAASDSLEAVQKLFKR